MESRKTHTSDENLANHRKLPGQNIRADPLNAHMAPKNHPAQPVKPLFLRLTDFSQGLWMERDENVRNRGHSA